MAKSGDLHISGQRIILLPALTITAAVATTATTPVTGLAGMKYLVVEAIFAGGTGGTSVDAYVQTSLDGGTTWIDIIQFSFANTAVKKVSAVNAAVALAAAVTPSDGALTANTILNGLLGAQLRLKYVTVGTYSGSTSLTVNAVTKG